MSKITKISLFVLLIGGALVAAYFAFQDTILGFFTGKAADKKTTAKTTGSTAATTASVATALTSTLPGVVTGLTATAAAGSTNLLWSAPSSGTTPTHYKVMRRTGTDGFAQIGTLITASVRAYSDTTGVTGTVYDYQVIAINEIGAGSASNTATATAIAAATAPNAATGLTATAIAGATNLSWTAPASGSAPNGYKVMRRTGANAYAQIGTTVAAPETTYRDTTGTAGTSYDYQVIAINAVGNAAASNTATATAVAAAAVPNAATGLTATATQGVTILSWTAPAAGSAPTGYKVMRRTGANAYAQIGATVNVPVTSYNDTTGTAGTTYDYQIVAVNGIGNAAASNTATATAYAASANAPGPATLSGEMLGSMPHLEWTAPGSGPAPTGYILYRSSNPVSGFLQIKDTAGLFWNDAGAPSATFYYKVVAYNANGIAVDSNVVSLVIS